MAKKTKKTYYKIVRSDFTSARAPKKIQYALNAWVTPVIAGSKLFVFDSYSAAYNFFDGVGDVIYECEVLNPVKPKYMCHWSSADLVEWWNVRNHSFKKMKKLATTRKVPTGTVFCDAVKLLIPARLKSL